MNDNERIKQEKDGLDVYQDILGYAKTGFHTITPEDMMLFRWYGIYEQKPKDGHFMMRIKVTNGDLTAEQARVVADVSRIYGRGITDVTTRQNFQFHWLTVEDFPDVIDRLKRVGVTTSGACGDITRNVTGCPVAGIDKEEVFDARPWGTQIHEFFLGNKDFSNLPRKYKISVAGCAGQCAMPEVNDIGAIGVKRPRANGEEELGFHVRVGGGLSARPFISKRLNMFVPQEKLLSVAIAVTEIFRDHGNRNNRKAARLKFLVNEWGIERFEEEVRARLDWTPDSAADWPDPKKHFRDHVGVHAQKQDGLYWVGATILTGRLTDVQLSEIARISEIYGDGNLRTTIQQNVLFPNVPQANVDPVIKALEAIDLQTSPSTFRRAAIACTGNEFCNLALTETKGLLREIVDHVEQTVAMDELIRINLNGCPNDCGHHHIGDIGLQGCLVKQGGGVVLEGYDLALGGRLGRDAKFVRAIRRKVPSSEIKYAIENLLNGYSAAKDDEEDFSDFVDRHSDDELAALMKTTFAEGVATEVPTAVPCVVD
jgi:sulfite reductase beta subunit-like hemoprotein